MDTCKLMEVPEFGNRTRVHRTDVLRKTETPGHKLFIVWYQ